jgi:hypothetical protein
MHPQDQALRYHISNGDMPGDRPRVIPFPRPHSSYVPLKFYGRDRRISSIMIELNRKLYMDEETGEKRMSFPAIQRIAAGLLSQLIRLPFLS